MASTTCGSASQAVEPSLLYSRNVPVKLSLASRDDRTELLTVRITLSAASATCAKTLRVHITSEEDAFFLHSLEVSEEDFQSLKAEQSILVDFSTFPSKFVELLEACVAHGTEDNPKFIAVLSGNCHVDGSSVPGESMLSIVETNLFKQLSHIALRFRPGNDSAIKRHLATRLIESKGHASALSEQLLASEAANAERSSEVASLQTRVAQMEVAETALRAELGSTHAEALALARAEALKETIETKQQYEQDKSALEAHHRTSEEGLRRRVTELEREVKTLTDRKYELDGKVSELSAKLGSADGELEMLRDAKAKWTKEQKELEKAMRTGEKTLAERDAKLAQVQSQNAERDEQIKLLKTQLKQAEGYLKSVEGSLEQTKGSAQKSEAERESLREEHGKTSKTVETLTTENKSLKAKIKLKSAVIAQQENLLEERQAALTDALRKGSSLEASLSDARSKEASAQATADERRAKIEECQELLSSNQRLISWLNSQVNEAQLGRIGVPSRASFGSTTLPVHASATTSHIPATSASLPMTSGGVPSRYTFRPSIAIPLAGK